MSLWKKFLHTLLKFKLFFQRTKRSFPFALMPFITDSKALITLALGEFVKGCAAKAGVKIDDQVRHIQFVFITNDSLEHLED